MKRSLYLIIYLITVILVPASVQAQENSSLRQVFTQAESDYRIGRLDQAIEQLQAHFEDFQGNLKQNACRTSRRLCERVYVGKRCLVEDYAEEQEQHYHRIEVERTATEEQFYNKVCQAKNCNYQLII